MTYRLYGEDGSGAGIVELALAEIGAAYEWVNVSLRGEEQRAATYASLNPQRKLPTLITPDGEVLTESSAIVLVLDERHPEAQLFPARGTPERAQALRWLAFLAAELYPVIEICDYPRRFAPDDATASAVREIALGIWRQRWPLLENAIAGAPWLLASGFCATDLYLAVLSRWSLEAGWRARQLPRVEAIAQAVARRPRLQAIWQRHHGG
jgi:glutathione S-transferase